MVIDKSTAMRFLLLFVFLILSAGSAKTQIIFGQPSTGSSGIVYTTWEVSTDTGST